MDNFSTHVGKRIKHFRKKQQITIEELAAKICKSKSAVSKYENGQISIDIETLSDIAKALNVCVYQLTYDAPPFSYNNTNNNLKLNRLLQGTSQLYVYNYNNKKKKIIKNLLQILYDEIDGKIEASYFYDVPDFDSYLNCDFYYTGSIICYDSLTYFLLENQTNPIEKIYMCVLNPLGLKPYTNGLATGLVSESLAPLGMRIIVSKTPITDNDALVEMLKLSKDDIKYIKDTNWLIVHNL